MVLVASVTAAVVLYKRRQCYLPMQGPKHRHSNIATALQLLLDILCPRESAASEGQIQHGLT